MHPGMTYGTKACILDLPMNSRSIHKLHEKKHRTEAGLFIVEGEKNILELLASNYVIREIYTTADFAKKHHKAIASGTFERQGAATPIIVDASELASFGTMQVNNAALAIVLQKKQALTAEHLIDELEKSENDFILVLDSISDPGNLGTIIRLADWFGIKRIVTSTDTTDLYNPKTIAATMGSFTRISLLATSLDVFLAGALKKKLPVIGATLDGKNIHAQALPKKGILVMGSESHGIKRELQKYLTEKVTIPRYGKAESLNVAAATAILLDTLKR